MKLRLLCSILALSLLSLSVPLADQAVAAQGGSSTVKSFFDSANKGKEAPPKEAPKPETPPKAEVKAETPAPEAPAAPAPAADNAVAQRAAAELALFSPLAEIAAENIQTTPDTRSLVYENVSITVPDLPDFAFRISKIAFDGMDAASFDGKPGDMTQVEKFSMLGIKLLSGETPMAEMEDYTIEGMNFAYRDILKALQENKNNPEGAKGISASLLPLLSQTTVRLAQMNNLRTDLGIVQASIERIEGANASSLSSGPIFMHNIKVSFQGMQVFSLAKFGYTQITLPENFKEVSQTQDPELIQQKMGEVMMDPFGTLDKLAIKGLLLDKLEANVPGTMPVALSQFVCDLLVENKAVSLTGKIQDLALAMSKFQDPGGLGILLEAVGNQDLLLSMDVAATCTAEMVVSLKTSLSEQAKGSLSLDAVYAQAAGSTGLIRSAELKADNKGILDLVLGAVALSMEAEGSYKDFLPGVVGGIQSAKAMFTDPKLAEAVDGAAQLIQNGGTFRFALNPTEPIDIDQLGGLIGQNPAPLGHEVSYTAPATPIAR